MLLSAKKGRTRELIGAFGIDAVFVLATLVAMIGAWAFSRTDSPTLSSILYAIAYLCGGYFGLIASFESLRGRRIDIDLLMILAAGGAAAVGAPFEGALLLFLFSLSNVLQNFALDRTKSAIRALSALKPDTAIVLDSPDSEGGTAVAVEQITVGSFVQIRPGERIALDARVVLGESTVDQSSITGESLPVDKQNGDEVLAGTMNQQGALVVEVTRASSESTLAKVITLVEQAQTNKAETQRFLDNFEQYYAIGVIGVTILAGLVPPYLFGTEWSVSIYRAITLMVAASPCALIISTPASILSSIGNGARRGILFKGGVHVEQAGAIQAIAFDKTGTLTEGRPVVFEILALDTMSENELLSAAASLESRSEHAIASAITAAAQQRGLSYESPEAFNSTSGLGVAGVVAGRTLQLGSPAMLASLTLEDENTRQEVGERIEELQRKTCTVVVLLERTGSGKWRAIGLIALRDRIRPEAKEVIAELKAAGIRHIVMLTGDNRMTAEAIAREAGVDHVIPELMPDEKLAAIERIEREYGPTAMVGDGVNDAPALAGARLGIAMGAAGSDVALESADIVLLSDDLRKLPYLIALSHSTRRTLIANIVVALSLIALMIVGIYTIDLPLPVAVIGHEGGTVLVSLNGVRLLMFRNRRERKARRAAEIERRHTADRPAA